MTNIKNKILFFLNLFTNGIERNFIYFPSQMFKGNINAEKIKLNRFDVPIIAQWIRINPTRWRDRISMRVELYGCNYGESEKNQIKL